MSSIGEQFKAAREARGMTVAEVAEATRIKPTHITAMERNAFEIFASPIYARGFIKLYAECVDLDPAPLLDAYRRLVQPVARPSLQADPGGAALSKGLQGRAPGAVLSDFRRALVAGWRRINPDRLRAAGWVGVAVMLALVALFGLRGILRASRARTARAPVSAERARTRPDRDEGDFLVLERPPDPYVDADSLGVSGDSTP